MQTRSKVRQEAEDPMVTDRTRRALAEPAVTYVTSLDESTQQLVMKAIVGQKSMDAGVIYRVRDLLNGSRSLQIFNRMYGYQLSHSDEDTGKIRYIDQFSAFAHVERMIPPDVEDRIMHACGFRGNDVSSSSSSTSWSEAELETARARAQQMVDEYRAGQLNAACPPGEMVMMPGYGGRTRDLAEAYPLFIDKRSRSIFAASGEKDLTEYDVWTVVRMGRPGDPPSRDQRVGGIVYLEVVPSRLKERRNGRKVKHKLSARTDPTEIDTALRYYLDTCKLLDGISAEQMITEQERVEAETERLLEMSPDELRAMHTAITTNMTASSECNDGDDDNNDDSQLDTSSVMDTE